jgi:hypothetical protein
MNVHRQNIDIYLRKSQSGLPHRSIPVDLSIFKKNCPYSVLPIIISLKFGLRKGEEEILLLSLIRVNFIFGYAFLGK